MTIRNVLIKNKPTCKMPRRKDPQSCKSQLSAWTSMIFRTAIILHLTDINGGESLADSQYRMLAVIGHVQNITLPCSVDPAADAVDDMVEWSRSDLNPRFVHLRRSGEDHLFDQNPSYKGRTSVSTDRLKVGDASLQLSKVRLSDEGTYRCFIPGLNTDLSVELVVEADIKITEAGSGMLECKSEGWHPEPEVIWLDSEHKLLSAGPKEVFRGPADLHTLSSRLTLGKGHSNNFTCRVQQNNQHREATIHVPDGFFMDSSPSARSVVGGVIVGVMFLIVVSFLIWKWRKNKMGPKKSCEDEESQSGREDSRCSSSKDPEKESLMKNEEECKAGSKALMSQGKVEVHDPARASEQPGLSCENKDDTSIHAAPTTQNERQQNNGQSGRDATKDMCSGENTQSGDKRPSVTETVTLPEPLDSNIKVPNQSLMDSSGQQQQLKQGEEVKNDTDKKDDTKKTQTTDDETTGQSTSEEEGKQNTGGQNNPEVQEKDGDGEKTGTANNQTAEPRDRNVNKPNPAEEQTERGQDHQEEDNKSKSNTPENNDTNQDPSGSTEQENQSGNNSQTDEGPEDGDQHGNSTVSSDATTGLKHQNHDDNGAKTETRNDETAGQSTREEEGKQNTEGQNNPEAQEKDGDGAKTGTAINETAEPLDRNVSQPTPAEEQTERGQDHQEDDKSKPNTPENNDTNQDPSGGTEQEKQSGNNSETDEHSEDGDQHGNSATSSDATTGLKHQNHDDNGAKTETRNDETTGQSTSGEEGKQNTGGQNNPEVQEKDGDGEKTGTAINQTAELLDRNVSQPTPAEQQTEEGQDHQEEDKSKSNTPENNDTNQDPSGGTEQENQSGNNSETDDHSEDEDQHGNSTVSSDATTGLKHQNHDDNGAKTETRNDETTGQSTREEEGKQNTGGQNNPEAQEKDGDGEKTGTAINQTAEPRDRNVSQPNPAEEQTERGQDHQEEDKSKPNTPENSGRNQDPSSGTEQENREKNLLGTDEHSEDGDQHGNSSTSSVATTGLKHQNHDDNGERTDSDKGPSHRDEAEGAGGKTGQGDTEKDSSQQPDAESSHAGSSVHSGNTEENLATNGVSAVADQERGTSSTSSAATSVVKHRNNDDNGERTDSDKGPSHRDEAEGGGGKTGQGDTEKGSREEHDTHF